MPTEVRHSVVLVEPISDQDRAEAKAAIDRLGRASTASGGASPAPAASAPGADAGSVPAPNAQPDAQAGANAVALHAAMASDSLSHHLVEALTVEPQTFTDLADKMPRRNGALLSNAQMRAVYRNVKRTENRLLAQQTISGPVVRSDFKRYDADNGGRYFLKRSALDALDAHLGR